MSFLDSDPAEREGNYLVRHWRGALSLPKAYWLNGVLAGAVVTFAAPPLVDSLHEAVGSLRISAILWFVFIAFFLTFWTWTQVGIWRSAGYHADRGGHEAWGIIARVLVGLSAAGLALQVYNLTLQGVEFGSLAFGTDPLGDDARIDLSRDGRTVAVTGNLTAGTADRLAAVAITAPNLAVIALDSPGGRMFEGQLIARLIHDRGLDTLVENHCASACTIVLIAGRRRTAGPDAAIGFHQPTFPGVEERERALMIADMRRLYSEGGVSGAFLDRVLRVPPDDMWYPTHEQLIAARVITTAIPPEVTEEVIIEE
jgi:hypothetical protein